ncbi:MAG TPA: ester cyclase [bacterium]|nr:ester cyclase [bacterium]
MDRDELRAIAERWIALWNPPFDGDAFEALHAADFVDESPAGRPPTRAGFAEGVVNLLRIFPDLRAEVEDLVIDEREQSVAVRWSARGTAVEPFLGREPTGRVTLLAGIEIIRVRGGRIARRWGEWDPGDGGE